MPEPTTTRNFRENLKHFFDLARKKPVVINRGAERYVLLSENEFSKMKEETMNLQKGLISALQHVMGEGLPEIDLDADEKNDKLLKDYEAKYARLKGKKSKVG